MSIHERLSKIIVDQLGLETDTIAADCTFEELGADSLDRADLIMEMEEEFNVEIPDNVAQTIRTVQQAVDYIEKACA